MRLPYADDELHSFFNSYKSFRVSRLAISLQVVEEYVFHRINLPREIILYYTILLFQNNQRNDETILPGMRSSDIEEGRRYGKSGYWYIGISSVQKETNYGAWHEGKENFLLPLFLAITITFYFSFRFLHSKAENMQKTQCSSRINPHPKTD